MSGWVDLSGRPFEPRDNAATRMDPKMVGPDRGVLSRTGLGRLRHGGLDPFSHPDIFYGLGRGFSQEAV